MRAKAYRGMCKCGHERRFHYLFVQRCQAEGCECDWFMYAYPSRPNPTLHVEPEAK